MEGRNSEKRKTCLKRNSNKKKPKKNKKQDQEERRISTPTGQGGNEEEGSKKRTSQKTTEGIGFEDKSHDPSPKRDGRKTERRKKLGTQGSEKLAAGLYNNPEIKRKNTQ